jgi:hypothetical protein
MTNFSEGYDIQHISRPRCSKPLKQKHYTMEDIRPLIQASDKELEEALKQQHIIEYKGIHRSRCAQDGNLRAF